VNLPAVEQRVRELQKKGRLDRLLHDANDRLPWSEILYVLHYAAIAGIAVQVVRMVMIASETKERPADAEFLWFVFLMLVGASLRVASWFARSKAERVARRVRRYGRVAPAAIVQANPGFFAPDNDQWRPAAVLLCFDPAAVAGPERLNAVAARLESLRRVDRRTLPADDAEIAWRLHHEMGPLPSFRVPGHLTDGLRDCLLVGVMLPPRPLVADECVLCLAVANELSPHAVAVLPAAVLG